MNIQQSEGASVDLVVDVEGMTKTFGNRTVVDRIGMQIPRGSVYGFLGPNGSGKTTFIRMLCGLLEPNAGSGTCLGFDVRSGQRAIKRKVGYMTQKFSYYEDLTVKENLEFVARLYSMNHRGERIRQTLDQLGLGARGKQLAGTLSGGWKQRLALAACLLHEPELLLLDEPTAGVDPQARRDFWEEIHRLAKQGLTVLVTTHYMDEAERCDYLAYIAYGKLLASGTATELIRHSGLLTCEISGHDMPQLLSHLRKHPDIVQCGMFGTTLHANGTDAGKIESALRSSCSPGQIWRAVPTTLEDVFIYLMSQSTDNFLSQKTGV